jgi:4-oxocyclohexanecarboxylate 2-dehydrogenase
MNEGKSYYGIGKIFADGRALDPFGEVIPGLLAVGNNSAHPSAFGYAGAGSTLGPGMTMAYVAGHTAVGSVAQPC